MASWLSLTGIWRIETSLAAPWLLSDRAVGTGVEEILTLATLLIQATRLGASIGDALREFSSDLRLEPMTRAQALAAKMPNKMLFP